MKNLFSDIYKGLPVVIAIVFSFSAFSVNAQNEKKLLRKGNENYKEKDFQDAEMQYRKSIELNPRSYPGNYNLGNALYKQEKQDEAIQYYSGSAAFNSDSKAKADAYYNMGNAYLKSEKYQESVDAYKEALKLNQNDDDARYNLAYALSKLKQQQQQQQQQDKKDQNKDQQKKDEQQKDQENKDKHQQEQEQQQRQRPPKISKEDAARMLQALKNDERNLQKKLSKRFEATMGNAEKDW